MPVVDYPRVESSFETSGWHKKRAVRRKGFGEETRRVHKRWELVLWS